MKHNHSLYHRTAGVTLGVVLSLAFSWVRAEAQGYTAVFGVDDCTFVNTGGDNKYWNLTPGAWYRLEGYEGTDFHEILITVKNTTKRIAMMIDGRFVVVMARESEHREWVNGQLVEVADDWLARCEETNDVYYFGEYVTNYPGGNHDGSWTAGLNGATPGVIMPGSFMIGARYFQEMAPSDGAMDQGENIAMGLDLSVPAGDYSDCILIKETTPVEPDANEFKYYCPGVGFAKDGDLELTARGLPL